MLKGKAVELSGKTTYERWSESQGIPIIREFYIKDLRQTKLAPWEWTGGLGAYLNLIGTEGNDDAYVCEIPPGKALRPKRHIFEEMTYVLQGRGATTIWLEGGEKHTFEWQRGSLFSAPLNSWHQHFNGSGHEPARFLAVTNAPTIMNLFHNLDFIFNNPFSFKDRFDGDPEYFSGGGNLYPSGPMQVWDTNFVADVRSINLHRRNNRGAGGSFLWLEVAENAMSGHLAEFPVGTYKKAHRHGPGTHVTVVSGKGYSVMWADGVPAEQFDWQDGSVIVPPEGWFHQHFNIGATPARYMALRFRGKKFPQSGKKSWGTDKSLKDGGDQIEYEDEDPKVHRKFEADLAQSGATCRMGILHPYCTQKA